MIFQLWELDQAGFELLPERCRGCGWWQGHDDGWPEKHAASWIETALERFGGWGKLAVGDEELLGMIQYGPSGLFGRSSDLACGPASRDAVLLTCSLVTKGAYLSVRKSLLTAVLAELKDREVEIVEAFCYQSSSPGEECRLFERQFLEDCGFYPVRSSRGLQLMRFELRGALPVKVEKHKSRRGILERIKRTSPTPAPAAMCGAEEARADRVPVCVTS